MPTFNAEIAMDVRAYGFVQIEADNIEEAVEKAKHLDHEAIGKRFTPHGTGSDDFDWLNPTAISIVLVTDGCKDVELFTDLPDPDRSHTEKALQECRGALASLLEQVEQMRGMFDDEDGTIASAISDAEAALK